MKILTVPSSNTGRSIGDVFLALFSASQLARKAAPVSFLTHTNHTGVTSFFRKSLDLMIFSDSADQHARHLNATNIHWNSGPWEERFPDISNPWRYFLMNGVAPGEISLELPKVSPRVGSRSIVIFPERSDNHRLSDALFADFIERAAADGFTIYTNCYLNSNYVVSPALPGTAPLAQLSLGEIVAIASDPSNIIVGTRSGLFDVLYFALPPEAARLVVLYPPEPAWIWSAARLHNEAMRKKFPDLYLHRENVVELEIGNFSAAVLAGHAA
ncbi:MAG: hypothetical protein H7343_15545 [Undibacterium sp.]|nr:hypothetical protein [Opitutaceae bacterium]